MLKTGRHKKQKDKYSVREKRLQNYSSSVADADVKGLKDSMKADAPRLPFEVLLQIMRAYSTFLAGSTIKTDTFTSYN